MNFLLFIMKSSNAQLHYSQAQEFIHNTEEWPYYASILGSCNHCQECPEEAAKGIVKRGSLVPIGDRQCLWNCCCMLQYHKTQDDDTNGHRLTSHSFGWVGISKLTLPVTVPVT